MKKLILFLLLSSCATIPVKRQYEIGADYSKESGVTGHINLTFTPK